jgi:hypothetical protein
MPVYRHGRFWPEDPRPGDFSIEAIARSLSRTPRFMGHTAVPYYVSQHCVWVSRRVRPEHAMLGLLHDAAEAYLGDVVSPVKRALGESYARLERAAAYAVYRQFGVEVTAEGMADVKRADAEALHTEARDLTPGMVLDCPGAPVGPPIVPLPWADAYDQFLSRFAELCHGPR